MPLVTVESSAAPVRPVDESLKALVRTIERTLDVKPPTEVRLRLVEVAPASAAVGGAIGEPGKPWVVAFAHLLEGRPEATVAAFMSAFAEALADCYGVDVGAVRVLVQTYPKMYWGIGSRSAAAVR